jgi:hypothetical protein
VDHKEKYALPKELLKKEEEMEKEVRLIRTEATLFTMIVLIYGLFSMYRSVSSKNSSTFELDRMYLKVMC